MKTSNVIERIHQLWESDKFSDVEFIIKGGDTVEKIKGHRALFAASSTIFENILFNGDSAKGSSVVEIEGIETEAFKSLKKFIYTDEISFVSVGHAKTVYEVADKYNFDLLLKEAESYLTSNLSSENVFTVLEFSRKFNKSNVENSCLDLIRKDTVAVLGRSEFLNCDLGFINVIVNEESLNISEIDLFNSIEYWAKTNKLVDEKIEGGSDGNEVKKDDEKQHQLLNEVIDKIRFLAMSPDEFAKGPNRSSLLTDKEKLSLIMNINVPGSMPLPDRFCSVNVPRKRKEKKRGNFLSIKEGGTSTPRRKSTTSCEIYLNTLNTSDLSIVQYGWTTIVKWKKDDMSTLEMGSKYYSPTFFLNGHPFRICIKPGTDGCLYMYLCCDCNDNTHGRNWSCNVKLTRRLLRREREPWSLRKTFIFNNANRECPILDYWWTQLVFDGFIKDDSLEIELHLDLQN